MGDSSERNKNKMMCQLEKDIADRLRAFRKEPINQDAFRDWVRKNHSRLAPQCAPGLILKLRSRDVQTIMSSIANLIPACSQCVQVGEQKIFESRAEQLSYARRVDATLNGGPLKRIKRPNWFQHDGAQLGPDGYFECTSCGAFWTLVEPERQYNGLWQRIA